METRATKKRKLELEKLQSNDPTFSPISYIPFDILFYLLTFAIVTNEGAKKTWSICSSWMKITDIIVAKLNPRWDFKSHYLSPMRLSRKGFSFWTHSFYQMTTDMIHYDSALKDDPDISWRFEQPSPLINIRIPDTLEIYDFTRHYRFAFRLHCPIANWTHNITMVPQAGYLPNGELVNVVQKRCSLDIHKTLTTMAIKYINKPESGPILELMDCKFDCKVSYKSIEDLDNFLSEIMSNRDSYIGRSVSLCIINGILMLGMTQPGIDDWIPVWNDKGLSMEEMIKIWPEWDEYTYTNRCDVYKSIIKTWINQLNLIGPFDFVNLKLIDPEEIWDCYHIYSTVVKDGISMCFQF